MSLIVAKESILETMRDLQTAALGERGGARYQDAASSLLAAHETATQALRNLRFAGLPPEAKIQQEQVIRHEFAARRAAWLDEHVTQPRQRIETARAAKYSAPVTDPLERIARHQDLELEWENLTASGEMDALPVFLEYGGSAGVDRLIQHPGFAQRIARKAGSGEAVERAHQRIRREQIENDPDLSVLAGLADACEGFAGMARDIEPA